VSGDRGWGDGARVFLPAVAVDTPVAPPAYAEPLPATPHTHAEPVPVTPATYAEPVPAEAPAPLVWASYPPPDPATAWPAYDPAAGVATWSGPGLSRYPAPAYPGSMPAGPAPAAWPYGSSWPYATYVPTPPRRRLSRRTTAILASATAAVVLVPTLTGFLMWRHDRDVRAQRQAAAQAAVDAHLATLESFVAQRTGRPWRQPVAAVVLDDSAFVSALHRASGGSPARAQGDVDDSGVTFTAMGLAPDPDSFWAAASDGSDANVVGFYDEGTRRLYVRGTSWTPYVEYVLVHELTHASQDQTYSLSTLWKGTSTADESSTALRALVEGEAMMIADDYRDQQDAAWQRAVETEDSRSTPSSVPVVELLGGFPYVVGEDFVRGLRTSCGPDAIRSAWADPPRWTISLLAPEQWCSPARLAVTPPPSPSVPAGFASGPQDVAHVRDIGVLGVLGLWAAVDADRPRLSDLRALDGWRGDRYVATENDSGDRWCFVDTAQFADAASRDRAVAFLQPWTTRIGVQVASPSPTTVTLSHCTT